MALEKDMALLKGEVRVIITMNVAILLLVAFVAFRT